MAIYLIKNDTIEASINSRGAVLKSIKKNGMQYLWQGCKGIWEKQDVNMFPYVARSNQGKYSLEGKTYPMPIHGFADSSEFSPVSCNRDMESITSSFQNTDDRIELELYDSAATLDMYPYHFRYSIVYQLEGNSLIKTCKVKNRDDKIMYFGMGSHPGFSLPEEAGDFECWQIEFEEARSVNRIVFDQKTLLVTGKEPYGQTPLKTLRLSHALFFDDAVVFEGSCGKAVLSSEKADVSITVEYPDCKYLGLWQKPTADSRYICIEPWYSLPARFDRVEEWAEQPDLLKVFPGEILSKSIRISLS